MPYITTFLHRLVLPRVVPAVDVLSHLRHSPRASREAVQFTKTCSSSNLTIGFSGTKIYVSFSMTSRLYPRLLSMKPNISPFFQSSNVEYFGYSINHSIAQRRSYSCGQKLTGLAGRNISHFLAKFIMSCRENQSYPPWEPFVIPCCFRPKINVFDFFHIQRPYVFANILIGFR
jgi:hypothetical protein